MRDAQDVDVLTPARRGRGWSSLRWSLPAAAAVVAVDQLTKAWALDTLAPGPCSVPDACIDLVAGIRFNLVFNTGAAFTRGAGYGPLIGVLAFVMTGVLLYLSTRRDDRFGVILFGVLAGGAVGNLLDRLFRADDGFLTGAVIDFIDVGWWPVFNLADSAIVIGVIGIIVHSFWVGEPDETEPDETEPDDTEPTDDGGEELGADGVDEPQEPDGSQAPDEPDPTDRSDGRGGGVETVAGPPTERTE